MKIALTLTALINTAVGLMFLMKGYFNPFETMTISMLGLIVVGVCQ